MQHINAFRKTGLETMRLNWSEHWAPEKPSARCCGCCCRWVGAARPAAGRAAWQEPALFALLTARINFQINQSDASMKCLQCAAFCTLGQQEQIHIGYRRKAFIAIPLCNSVKYFINLSFSFSGPVLMKPNPQFWSSVLSAPHKPKLCNWNSALRHFQYWKLLWVEQTR